MGRANDIVQLALVPILVILISDDKFGRKVFAALFMYVIMTALEPLCILFFTALGGVINETASSNLLANMGAYVLVRVVLFLFTCILCYVSVIVWNRTLNKAGKWDLLTFLLFPLSQMLLSWFATDMATRAGSTEKSYMVLSVLMVVSIAADVVMVVAINRLRAADEAKQRTGFLEQQLMQQQSYYDRVKSDAEDTSRVLHDLRSQIQTAYALIDEGNDASACREDGIELKSQLAVRSGTKIDEMDLCSVFANVMDNALNSCRKCSDQKAEIKISASKKARYLTLICENTAHPAQDDGKKGRRRDPLSEHGWGLEILSNLAEKYDGRLETGLEDSTFTTKVFLKMQ